MPQPHLTYLNIQKITIMCLEGGLKICFKQYCNPTKLHPLAPLTVMSQWQNSPAQLPWNLSLQSPHQVRITVSASVEARVVVNRYVDSLGHLVTLKVSISLDVLDILY